MDFPSSETPVDEGRQPRLVQRGRPNRPPPVLHRQQRSHAAPPPRVQRQRERRGQRKVDAAPRRRHLRPPQTGQVKTTALPQAPTTSFLSQDSHIEGGESAGGQRRREHALRHLRGRGGPRLHRGRDGQTGGDPAADRRHQGGHREADVGRHEENRGERRRPGGVRLPGGHAGRSGR